MRTIAGKVATYDGAMTIMLGFVPDFVRLFNTAGDNAWWNLGMARSAMGGFWVDVNGTTNGTIAAYTDGILPFDPDKAGIGETYTSQSALGKLKKWDAGVPSNLLNGISNNRRGDIRYWYRNSVTGFPHGCAGYFLAADNATAQAIDGTYVVSGKAGSRITIRETATGKEVNTFIVSLTSTGASASQVVLADNVGNGEILYMSGSYDFIDAAVGDRLQKGIHIIDYGATFELNDASGDQMYIEAMQYDMA